MSELAQAGLIEWLAAIVVCAPIVGFVAIGSTYLLGRMPSERALSRIARTVFSVSLGASLGVVAAMLAEDVSAVHVAMGNWFSVGDYGYELQLQIDRLSAPMMVLASTLCGVVGHFSDRYLHREIGARRFMLLLMAFAGGVQLIFMAGSLDLLFVGWEVVGVTSVLLIAFFNDRIAPVRSALRVFVTYRLCDVGLITAAVLLHHFAHTAHFPGLFSGSWPDATSSLSQAQALEVGAALIIASLGKSAQLPFSGWLPRAMLGPTPSSAIFYGALSVHAGAYLLLRFAPLFAESPWLSGAVVLIGALTALHGTLVGRVQSDVKSGLAYAAVAQVGIIYVEIGLGFYQLALAHMLGHAGLRAVQLLRAPSVLEEHERHRSAVGPMLGRTGAHFERLLPERLRARAYAWALSEHHVDAVLWRVLVHPFIAFFERCERVEQSFTDWLGGKAGAEEPVVRPRTRSSRYQTGRP